MHVRTVFLEFEGCMLCSIAQAMMNEQLWKFRGWICIPSLPFYMYSWRSAGTVRKYFIHAVDAEAIVTELTHKCIITAAHQEEMNQSKDWTAEQNQFLYDHLLTTSTKESFLAVYGIIKAVPGNPRMKHLGEDMTIMLEGQLVCCIHCLYLFVHARMLCVCACVHMFVNS